jgi:3-keto-disaccharide hydrolase
MKIFKVFIMICLSRSPLLAISLIPQFVRAQTAVQLFNHQDLNGWYAYNKESGKHANATDLFVVENQMIRLYGDIAGYLMSEESFHNFQLTAEFRWNTDTTFVRRNQTKNSGVMYLVPVEAPDMLWPKGIQFQIKEGATGDFILLQDVTLRIKGEKTEPGKSVAATRFEDAANPIGKWNTLVVTCLNGNIKQELNGKLVNEGDDPSVSEGRILLQYEGFPIDFRVVEIVKL